MKPVYPNSIACAVLFDRMPFMQAKPLQQLLDTIGKQAGARFDISASGKPPGLLVLKGGGVHVQIEQTEAPLDMAGFEAALNSAYTKLIFPGAEGQVRSHRSHALITVSHGAPFAARHPATEAGSLDTHLFKPDTYELAVNVMRAIAMTYCHLRKPLAVHWCQSDQLLPEETFKKLASARDITMLQLHPRLFSPGGHLGPGVELGCITHGAKNLIGREIEFSPAPVELTWMLDRICQFVAMAKMDNEIMRDGDTFGIDEAEKIRVTHKTDNGEAIIKLTLLGEDDSDDETQVFGKAISQPAPELPAAGLSAVSGSNDNPDDDDSDGSRTRAEDFDLTDPIERAMYEAVVQKRQEMEAGMHDEMRATGTGPMQRGNGGFGQRSFGRREDDKPA